MRDVSASVCVPDPPPTTSEVAVKVVSNVTVYVPARLISTESVDNGSRPRLQFDGTFHEPPAAFVHVIVVAVMSNGLLVAEANTPELAVSV